MTQQNPNSLKPGEATLIVSPTSGAAYRGSAIVMLASLAIVGAFMTCGWYVQTQVTLLRSEMQVARAEMRQEMSELRMAIMTGARLTPAVRAP